MANSISTRSAVLVQFNIDTDGAGATAPPPLALLCNRDYYVADLAINNTTAGVISGTITNTTAANPPVVSTISTIDTLAANTITRPLAVAAGGVGTVNLDTAYNTVLRGSTVKVNMTAAGDFCTGYLTVLPGNRYSAVTLNAAYYANNSASGNSSASVAI
jgi:hypothetical protein